MNGGIINFITQKTSLLLMTFELLIKKAFLIFLFIITIKANAEESNITVLMYHRIGDDKYPSTNISKELFEEHIKYLVEENINVLPITELSKYLKKEINLPNKTVFITFDDAYKSFFQNGFPILKKNKLPFSIFVSSHYVSNAEESDFMSWSMLKEVSESNGLILNHSKSHESLVGMDIQTLKKEIEQNQIEIEKNIGEQPKIFSYPYGESSKNIEEVLKLLNYEIAFSQHSAPIHFNQNIYRLPRYALNDEFGSLKRFKMILKTKPLEIFQSSFDDSIINTDKFHFSFLSKIPSKFINCFINNSASMIKKDRGEKVNLYLSKLKNGVRYRINCTYINQKGEIFWYGKMIKRVN
ncbi:MAG: polysaccharide deacetylase [Alphaproteobacteria bacterium]|nr:MAG: polysaccharide deacetylase [Alphaproteobacteria bacterium]